MIVMRAFAFGGGRFALALAALAFTVLAWPLPAAAQETLPQNPPELKDFRLDQPPPREELPLPEKKQDPPASVPPETQRSEPAPKTPFPAPSTKAAPADPRAAATATASEDNSNAPPADTDATLTTPGDSADGLTPTAGQAAPDRQSIGDAGQSFSAMLPPWWPFLAIAFAALAALLFFRALSKRTAVTPAAAPPEPDAKKQRQRPTPMPAGGLSASFHPGKARLSLANLTVTGQLHVRFEGAEPLGNLMLRTRLMSACDDQTALIRHFHDDATQGDRQDLGMVRPGEQIDLTLELQVPRDTLQAFDWRQRRFVAPIILINLADEHGAVTPCRLACVMGQAGSGASPRMTPIPIDRGPKQFESVQFQPIVA